MHTSERNNKEIWKILNHIAEERMTRGEFLVIDATNITTKDINRYCSLAKTYRYRIIGVDFTDVMPLSVIMLVFMIMPLFVIIPLFPIMPMFPIMPEFVVMPWFMVMRRFMVLLLFVVIPGFLTMLWYLPWPIYWYLDLSAVDMTLPLFIVIKTKKSP